MKENEDANLTLYCFFLICMSCRLEVDIDIHPNKKAATGACQQKSDNTHKKWNGTKQAHVQHPGPSVPLPPRQHYHVRRLEPQTPPTHHLVNHQPLYNMATGAARGNNPFLNAVRRILVVSVYLPSNGCKNHQIEYQEYIDELHEICQKYNSTHHIVIGGDINEDLNAGKPTNQRKEYLKKLINETELKFDNIGNTFVNSKGCECSEIDYFLHNLTPDILQKGKSNLKCLTNASDHYPISMSINWKHEKLDMNQKARPHFKIKWDKVDKALYKAITDAEVLKLQESMITDSLESQEVIERMNDILTTASQTSSGNKTIYHSRPKLKVWNGDIKNALKEKRITYNEWQKDGRPNDPTNPLTLRKKQEKWNLGKKYALL
ncbi:unnamed protein product [Mytilus coruscus]|uniref:Endonuclease/exonuclease/phosphatase domain-containing protein n=1 Tax=Mytilus coruscus TaxID=42192 RepID=A0A6J8EM79_MYTCO|nr:unnamed protein product [Mytilus coruscus]